MEVLAHDFLPKDLARIAVEARQSTEEMGWLF